VIIHDINHFLVEALPLLSFCMKRSRPIFLDGPIMSLVLRYATIQLRDRGYNILALDFQIKSSKFLGFPSLTIFTLDDDLIFSQGCQDFMNNVRYNILPNLRSLYTNLLTIPMGTGFDTLLQGQHLMVRYRNPFSVNGIYLKNPNYFYNELILVHGILTPFTFWW
jgi:hypothetical protein